MSIKPFSEIRYAELRSAIPKTPWIKTGVAQQSCAKPYFKLSENGLMLTIFLLSYKNCTYIHYNKQLQYYAQFPKSDCYFISEYILVFGSSNEPTAKSLLDTLLGEFGIHTLCIPQLTIEEVRRHLAP